MAKKPEESVCVEIDRLLAVTVGTIPAGTDINPLEIAMPQRTVTSRSFFEETKRLGVREISPHDPEDFALRRFLGPAAGNRSSPACSVRPNATNI